MSELERELRSLAAEIAWPPTPRLTPQLAPQLVPRWHRRRRGALLAVVVAAVALGVAFVVPGARSAILRFFHLGGVTIERVVTLPPAQKRPLDADLGRLVDSATAERALGAPVRLPALAQAPRLHLAGGVVSTILATPRPVLLSEFRSGAQSYLFKKFAAGSTAVRPVHVGRSPGLWIAGGEHVLLPRAAPPRLAGNALLWQRGAITYRLEGRGLTERLALRLAIETTGT